MKASHYGYKCTKCNSIVGKDDKYCENCGAELIKEDYEEVNINNENSLNAKYVQLNSRTKLLIFFLCLFIIISVFSIFTDISLIKLINRFNDGYYVSEFELNEIDTRISSLAILSIIVNILIIIIYLNWKYCAYKNLTILSKSNLKYSAGWAVGSYFIPILWFYRPYQIMKEIWNSSEINSEGFNENKNSFLNIIPSNLIVPLWWTCFLISNYLSYYTFKLSRNLYTIEQIETYSKTLLISDIMDIPSALFLIILAKRLSLNQEIKYLQINNTTTSTNSQDL